MSSETLFQQFVMAHFAVAYPAASLGLPMPVARVLGYTAGYLITHCNAVREPLRMGRVRDNQSLPVAVKNALGIQLVSFIRGPTE